MFFLSNVFVFKRTFPNYSTVLFSTVGARVAGKRARREKSRGWGPLMVGPPNEISQGRIYFIPLFFLFFLFSYGEKSENVT